MFIARITLIVCFLFCLAKSIAGEWQLGALIFSSVNNDPTNSYGEIPIGAEASTGSTPEAKPKSWVGKI